ncbi:MAG: biopolymer transporter ExbD [Opitutales bacterium]|nr:biopolymer transporter ExbD [Opitutales bacterium]
MSSLVDPLNLQQRMRRRPQGGLDPTPFIDLLIILAVFALAVSRFVQAPGMELDLVRATSFTHTLATPTAALTIDLHGSVFFQGLKIPEERLASTLRAYVEQQAQEPLVLLVMADVSMNLEHLFGLMDMAREAGFHQVQLAAEDIWSGQNPF